MKKVMLIFGTRPEAIKMAPLVRAMQCEARHFKVVVCVTGQHREMLDQVMHLFNIKAQYDLNIMKECHDLYDITAQVLTRMRPVLAKERPDVVLVHGDTTTSMAAALAAFYQHIPVGHVEAGLRTHNLQSPWPEELNRQFTARIAQWHFAPTQLSRKNLMDEGIDEHKVYVTGNTVIDALHFIVKKLEMKSDTCEEQPKQRRVIITGHRRENLGSGLERVCCAIKDLAARYPNVEFEYFVHPNPRVRNTVCKCLGVNNNIPQKNGNIQLAEPLDYLEFVNFMAHSTLVITDSGGIQEEAPGLGVPVIVTRDTTERPEAIEAGTAKLVGTDKEKIVEAVSLLLDNENEYMKMRHAFNPYGNGTACDYILDVLRNDATYLN